MASNQPGFDILSEDPTSGKRRLIEVKGVQGIYESGSSVVLTARQVHDAIRTDDGSIEYWLYVVESTESERPKVLPIPWTQCRDDLRYGFCADIWRPCEEPIRDRQEDNQVEV